MLKTAQMKKEKRKRQEESVSLKMTKNICTFFGLWSFIAIIILCVTTDTNRKRISLCSFPCERGTSNTHAECTFNTFTGGTDEGQGDIREKQNSRDLLFSFFFSNVGRTGIVCNGGEPFLSLSTTLTFVCCWLGELWPPSSSKENRFPGPPPVDRG